MKQLFYQSLLLITFPLITLEKSPSQMVPSLVDLSVPEVVKLIQEGKAKLEKLPRELQEKIAEYHKYQKRVDKFVSTANYAQDVKELHEFQGIPINARSAWNGNTALIAASGGGAHISVVEHLLRSNAQVNMKNTDGQTALMRAVIRGSVAIANKLLQAGADLNVRDNEGKTALMYGILKQNRDRENMVDTLLKAGAAVNIQDNNGMTALMHAMNLTNYYYADRLASLLFPYKPKLDIQNKHGMTALMFAAETGDKKSVKRLLDAGADPHILDNENKNAAQYAKENANDIEAKMINDFIAKNKFKKIA